jgi:hypothetical protein
MPGEARPAILEKEDRRASGSSLKRWLQEPLVHFLVIGLVLFVVYRLLNPVATQSNSFRIALTEDDLGQLDISWRAQWQRPPTPEEMHGLIESRVREEILYREALALGLDQGDTIVKRRLAQKMEFLAEDVSAVRDPQPGELEAWFLKNSSRFTLPGGITFHHVYFSPDKRDQRTREDAARALKALSGKPASAPEAASLGDRFSFQDYYSDRSPDQVASVFGTKFAEAIFKLTSGSWQGPVESGLGWHVLWIDSLAPGRVPAFEEMEPSQVKSEWMTDQRGESKRNAFEAIKARYQIVLPADR